MAKIIDMLKNQAGRISIARVCSVVTFLLWTLTWLYTLIMKQTYSHFDTITIAMLIMFFVILCGKAVDSRLVSIKEGK